MINADKKTLRRYFSDLRNRLHSETADNSVTMRILADANIMEADNILLYASFGSEVDTWTLAEKLLAGNMNVAFPKCGKNRTMTFHTVTSLEQLEIGMYGIREPDIRLPQPDFTRNTVCIVPGLAFTENGGRLGYGGGYYDTFLNANPHIYTIAAAYEKLVVKELPLAEHDIKVKKIITEERTALCDE